MTDDEFNDTFEKYSDVFRKAIAWELLLWAKTFDSINEVHDAIVECAHHVAADERPTSANNRLADGTLMDSSGATERQ